MLLQTRVLTLAGALPFIAAAALGLAGFDSVAPIGSVERLAVSYGLVIASFVAGTHWGMYLQRQIDGRLNLFVASNVAVLLPWITFLTASAQTVLVTLIVTFLFLFGIDTLLRRGNIIDAGYLTTRLIATLVVCTSLGVVLVAL